MEQGFRVLTLMSVKLIFKDYLRLEPGQAQLIDALIFIPVGLKWLYGLYTEQMPVFGSDR